MQDLLRALMESPLYWLLTIRQRLDLIQRFDDKNSPCSPFRQRALSWVKTGAWEEGAAKEL